MSVYNIDVVGEPAPWCVYTRRGSPSKGFVAMQAWQEQIRAAIIEKYGRPLLTGPVQLEAIFYCSLPGRLPKSEALYKRRCLTARVKRPDLTNLLKAAEDALKGVLVEDDSQVVHIRVSKQFVTFSITWEPDPWTYIRLETIEVPK